MNALLFAAALYVGAFGQMDIPQGGSDARLRGGAGLRVGAYLDDEAYFAMEGETAWMEDSVALAARGLVHWQAWSVYGDLFGFSQFDPFFTIGACGRIGSDAGMVGPETGVGAFYHLGDKLSLRADARAALDLNGREEMRYSFSVGIQYGF